MMSSLIISPSGNLYGSERVLLDFLKFSSQNHYLFVPRNSLLYTEVKKARLSAAIYNNSRLKFFYLRLIIILLYRRIKNIYINEGAHINYIKLLSHIFPKRSFFVHLRILEDINPKRIGKLNPNITLITISKYMLDELNSFGYSEVRLLNDPFPFRERQVGDKENILLSIAIVGRFTKTKGSDLAMQFFQFIEDKLEDSINLTLYGNIDEADAMQEIIVELNSFEKINLSMPGFVENAEEIYQHCDLVMHFNPNEPLGRIFFESIDHLVPFIGFKSGGIGEIGRACKLENYLVELTKGWEDRMFTILKKIQKNRQVGISHLKEAKKLAGVLFSAEDYTRKLESIISAKK